MNRMMIDFETLSLKPLPAVIQVGFVIFDEDSVLTKQSHRVSILSSIRAGGDISSDTLGFWRSQDQHVVDKVGVGDHITLRDAMDQLGTHYKHWECKEIWAHGVASDIFWLKNILAALDMSEFWTYRQPRDTRTLFGLARRYEWDIPTRLGLLHDAGDDAENQALSVISAEKYISDSFTSISKS